jgi:hypothetical protein
MRLEGTYSDGKPRWVWRHWVEGDGLEEVHPRTASRMIARFIIEGEKRGGV